MSSYNIMEETQRPDRSLALSTTYDFLEGESDTPPTFEQVVEFLKEEIDEAREELKRRCEGEELREGATPVNDSVLAFLYDALPHIKFGGVIEDPCAVLHSHFVRIAQPRAFQPLRECGEIPEDLRREIGMSCHLRDRETARRYGRLQQIVSG